MPSIERRTPKYRHYKPKDLGVVRINGRDRYLGEFDSPESWEKYHRLVAKWISGDQIAIASNNSGLVDDVTVNQVLLAYCKFARSYYVRDGEFTSEVQQALWGQAVISD
ncbi:MAG: hypothetical protein WBF93_04780 [Pirellulales bacterium]